MPGERERDTDVWSVPCAFGRGQDDDRCQLLPRTHLGKRKVESTTGLEGRQPAGIGRTTIAHALGQTVFRTHPEDLSAFVTPRCRVFTPAPDCREKQSRARGMLP